MNSFIGLFSIGVFSRRFCKGDCGLHLISYSVDLLGGLTGSFEILELNFLSINLLNLDPVVDTLRLGPKSIESSMRLRLVALVEVLWIPEL
jgi:hypothetical protein